MKSGSDALLAAAALSLVWAMVGCGEHDAAIIAAGSEPAAVGGDPMRLEVLRKAVITNGMERAADLVVPVDPEKVAVGRLLFESKLMSVNGSISCRDCHLDEFGSTDGLANAVGVGGEGKGSARLGSGGRILPRNVLPFWGRGSKGFDTFFWDGKVAKSGDRIISQFGDRAPSRDALVVAVHLPSVELREMVADTPRVREELVSEDVSAATSVQERLARRFAQDRKIGPALARAYGLQAAQVTFSHVGDALAAFIRDEFRIRATRLERFAYGGEGLTARELAGGILFYGRGKCATCHNGPYFSDFGFHAVAFPQKGFGKNGFGTDEGRYNVTLDPKDRFLFRTPPLHNVTKTPPYSHSGSVEGLREAIVAHFDPLRLVDTTEMKPRERADLYARLGPAARETLPSNLTDPEVDELVAFLATLEFEKGS